MDAPLATGHVCPCLRNGKNEAWRRDLSCFFLSPKLGQCWGFWGWGTVGGQNLFRTAVQKLNDSIPKQKYHRSGFNHGDSFCGEIEGIVVSIHMLNRSGGLLDWALWSRYSAFPQKTGLRQPRYLGGEVFGVSSGILSHRAQNL